MNSESPQNGIANFFIFRGSIYLFSVLANKSGQVFSQKLDEFHVEFLRILLEILIEQNFNPVLGNVGSDSFQNIVIVEAIGQHRAIFVFQVGFFVNLDVGVIFVGDGGHRIINEDIALLHQLGHTAQEALGNLILTANDEQ